MSRPASLLETVKGLIERTYRMPGVLDDVGRFVIGDLGLRALYDGTHGSAAVEAEDGSGARTLVRETDEGVRVCVYYPDALIGWLERHPPQRGLGDLNVDAFAVLVEELDHLLVIAERALHDRPVTLFELELHANVSKYLVLARFLAGAEGRLGPRRRHWLRYHLFHKAAFAESTPSVRERYRDARRLALRFLRGTDRLRASERLGALRRFHRESSTGKVGLIENLAA